MSIDGYAFKDGLREIGTGRGDYGSNSLSESLMRIAEAQTETNRLHAAELLLKFDPSNQDALNLINAVVRQ
jgi:hypothetical protein